MLRFCASVLIALFAVLPSAQAQACGDLYGQFISNGLSAYVEGRRPAIEEKVRNELGKGDRFARGITLYNINARMGPTDFQYAGNEVLYTIRGNYLYFKSTTPSVFGSYADPAFEVHFDIELRGPITAPLNGPPYSDGMAARIPVMTVKPRNVSGDIVTLMINIFSLTGPGADAIQQVVDTHLTRDVTRYVNDYLIAQTTGISFMSSRKNGSITTFSNPMYDCGGAPAAVDICRSWGTDCGEPAAQEFCRRQGFNYTIEHTAASGRGPTWVPISQRLCMGPQCGSFASISCSNSAKLEIGDKIKTSPSSTVTGSMPVDRSTVITREGSSISGAIGSPNQSAGSAVQTRTTPPLAAATSTPDMSCKPGYVWRDARPGDTVCVTPESRALVASETASAASRTDPNGAWGPATCLSGLVWREAFDGDTVCVTPERRSAVKSENAAAASRRVSVN